MSGDENDQIAQGISLDSLLASVRLNALLADATRAFAGFSDLADAAVASTDGEGVAARIILDSSAVGHGWFIDPTPLDNSDEFLPTADPTIWKAKAGSAADGKMDMLSVLLHEYFGGATASR